MTETQRDIWMDVQGHLAVIRSKQSHAECQDIPKKQWEAFFPAANPCRNMSKPFTQTCCLAPSPLFLFWEGKKDSRQVSTEILHWTFPFHQANTFTQQKSLSCAESQVWKRRQNAWPQITLQPQQRTGEVQSYLKTSANRRAVRDTARKKQKSLGSNDLFYHAAAREVL